MTTKSKYNIEFKALCMIKKDNKYVAYVRKDFKPTKENILNYNVVILFLRYSDKPIAMFRDGVRVVARKDWWLVDIIKEVGYVYNKNKG